MKPLSPSLRRWLLGSVVIAATLYFVSIRVFSQTIESPIRKPFIAYQIEQKFGKDHVNPATVPSMLARRSDGSEVHSFNTPAPDGSSVETREVTDLRKNRYFILDTSAKTITTFYHAPGNLSKSVASHQVCPSEALSASAQKAVLLGHPVSIYSETVIDNAVTINVKAALQANPRRTRTWKVFTAGCEISV